ncbi:MAG: APC family permease [Sulfobacillus thermosulfidooxidans]|uniref:APC family permease n=1 Tax=Sulfobacillus thermosulfidooxidans TaxID=28034 RepID=A0A2T2X4N6_SULTH|nr:MAG: APC family permease [Sulfobacillus thermosulfidooxidans]
MNRRNRSVRDNDLHANVVGFWSLVSQSLAGMAPSCDVVAFMTAGAAFALVALPLSYLLAFGLMFIEVNTLYHLSKDRASAGGYYSYVSAGLGPKASLLTGFMVIFYQTLSVAGIPVYIGGVFLPGLAARLHINLPHEFWLFAILFFIGVPWLLAVMGIRPSIKVLATTSLIEISFLIVASIIIMIKAAPSTPLRPFEIGSVGIRGVSLGMVFAITSFIGIGSHSSLGEETKAVQTQRGRLIGKAALVSLTLTGAALTLSAYALTVGWGMFRMNSFSTANAPGVTVFLRYLGPIGAASLVILALNSALADSIALLTSSSRVLYAIGRDELIHTGFAQVNGRRAPARSVSALAAFAVITGIGIASWLGPSTAFNVMTTAVLFGLVSAHTLMNISLMRLFRKEHQQSHFLQHVVLPILAIVLFWWVLYESVWPIAYPLSLSALIWLVVLIPSLIYIAKVSGRVSSAQKHRLGLPAPAAPKKPK